jgi:hypothetical protein
MAKQGVSISFRLHPSDEREKQAIEIIQGLEEKGYSIREIMTDALLRASGVTPEMFRDNGEKLTPSLLETLLTDFGKDLIRQIRESGGVASNQQSSAKPSPFDNEDEEVDFASMQNLIKGHVSRSGGKK